MGRNPLIISQKLGHSQRLKFILRKGNHQQLRLPKRGAPVQNRQAEALRRSHKQAHLGTQRPAFVEASGRIEGRNRYIRPRPRAHIAQFAYTSRCC